MRTENGTAVLDGRKAMEPRNVVLDPGLSVRARPRTEAASAPDRSGTMADAGRRRPRGRPRRGRW